MPAAVRSVDDVRRFYRHLQAFVDAGRLRPEEKPPASVVRDFVRVREAAGHYRPSYVGNAYDLSFDPKHMASVGDVLAITEQLDSMCNEYAAEQARKLLDKGPS